MKVVSRIWGTRCMFVQKRGKERKRLRFHRGEKNAKGSWFISKQFLSPPSSQSLQR